MIGEKFQGTGSVFTQHANNRVWERTTTNNTSIRMAIDKMLRSLKKSQRIEKKENAMLGDNGQFCCIRNLYVYFAQFLAEIISARQCCDCYGQGYLGHVLKFFSWCLDSREPSFSLPFILFTCLLVRPSKSTIFHDP
jgi:hypothetical protein